MAPTDIPKTAVTTPFGLFEFVRMPFGLRNAAQTFQLFMDQVLRSLPSVSVYIDDVLIASPIPEQQNDMKNDTKNVKTENDTKNVRTERIQENGYQ